MRSANVSLKRLGPRLIVADEFQCHGVALLDVGDVQEEECKDMRQSGREQ